MLRVAVLVVFLICGTHGHTSTITDPTAHKKALQVKPADISLETINKTGISTDLYECVDDTECDRGHRCQEEVFTCTEIPQCDPWQARENGEKHGACILCRSDTDCGWSAGDANHCWPDGACRSVPPFFIMTFIKHDNVTANGPVVEPASTFSRGQTMCASIIPSAGDQRDHLDVSIQRVEMCALRQTAKLSKSRRSLLKKELGAQHGEELETYPYDGIEPYDPLFHDSTGCRSDKDSIRVFTVYDTTKDKFVDYHHFEAFKEVGLPGTSTVCFQALPISPRKVPVYMEFTVSVKGSNKPIDPEEIQEVTGQFEAFGLKDHDGETSNPVAKWKGVVSTSQDVELFIGCPGGKEFDGVAGICERPSVAQELYFWVLLLGVVVLVVGCVVFVLEYNKAQMHLE